jgi:hypothetical protein
VLVLASPLFAPPPPQLGTCFPLRVATGAVMLSGGQGEALGQIEPRAGPTRASEHRQGQRLVSPGMSICDCPAPDRDLCPDCRGWGYHPGTSGADRPLCPRCHGYGGQTPHDPECAMWDLRPAD